MSINLFLFYIMLRVPPPPRPVNTLIIQTTAERKTGKFQNETKAILLFFMVDLHNYLRFLAWVIHTEGEIKWRAQLATWNGIGFISFYSEKIKHHRSNRKLLLPIFSYIHSLPLTENYQAISIKYHGACFLVHRCFHSVFEVSIW